MAEQHKVHPLASGTANSVVGHSIHQDSAESPYTKHNRPCRLRSEKSQNAHDDDYGRFSLPSLGGGPLTENSINVQGLTDVIITGPRCMKALKGDAALDT